MSHFIFRLLLRQFFNQRALNFAKGGGHEILRGGSRALKFFQAHVPCIHKHFRFEMAKIIRENTMEPRCALALSKGLRPHQFRKLFAQSHLWDAVGNGREVWLPLEIKVDSRLLAPLRKDLGVGVLNDSLLRLSSRTDQKRQVQALVEGLWPRNRVEGVPVERG